MKKKYPLLRESNETKIISEGLNYHLTKKIPLINNIYRPGSTKYFELWNEARSLFDNNQILLSEEDKEVINDTDIGHYGLYEEWDIGEKVFTKTDDKWELYSLIIENVGNKKWRLMNGDIISETSSKFMCENTHKVFLDFPLTEAEYKGKKVELNKPKRGGSKKFYVYVKDPKTKKIKKVSFGAKGGGQSLAVKIKDSKARSNFAKRHRCSEKNDKTKPSYWSCRLPRYAKLLGLKSSYGGFW